MRAGDGDEPSHVVVLRTLGAPERRRMRGRRGKAVDPEPEATPVATARATVVLAGEPLEDEDAGGLWTAAAGGDEADDALALLNRMIALHRVAAADPYVREVAAEQALVRRAGYGAGEQVAEGRWAEARELPPPSAERRRRSDLLRPQERLARLLGARELPLAGEDLLLRARLDVEAGRWRAAALQLRAAADVLLPELNAEGLASLADRLAELRERGAALSAVANAAVVGELDADEREIVGTLVRRYEAALRARAAAT